MSNDDFPEWLLWAKRLKDEHRALVKRIESLELECARLRESDAAPALHHPAAAASTTTTTTRTTTTPPQPPPLPLPLPRSPGGRTSPLAQRRNGQDRAPNPEPRFRHIKADKAAIAITNSSTTPPYATDISSSPACPPPSSPLQYHHHQQAARRRPSEISTVADDSSLHSIPPLARSSSPSPVHEKLQMAALNLQPAPPPPVAYSPLPLSSQRPYPGTVESLQRPQRPNETLDAYYRWSQCAQSLREMKAVGNFLSGMSSRHQRFALGSALQKRCGGGTGGGAGGGGGEGGAGNEEGGRTVCWRDLAEEVQAMIGAAERRRKRGRRELDLDLEVEEWTG